MDSQRGPAERSAQMPAEPSTQMNGPRCAVASRGPGVLRFSEECLAQAISCSGSHSTWPLRVDPCVDVQIVGGAMQQAAVSPTLRRDLAAKQGRWSEPVASCSSPRVGRRTLACWMAVRIPACRPCAGPVGNSCEAGSQCFASPTGAARANAAPDLVRCQVRLASGSVLCTVNPVPVPIYLR